MSGVCKKRLPQCAPQPILALALFLPAVLGCDPHGTWVDRKGNIATLALSPDGSIAATSFSATRWHTAVGRVVDDTHLWLAFHPTDNETGTFVSNCSTLVLPGAAPSVWGKVGSYMYGTDVTVTDVHLVFMSHLDLGACLPPTLRLLSLRDLFSSHTSLAPTRPHQGTLTSRATCVTRTSLATFLRMPSWQRRWPTRPRPLLTSHAFLIAEFLDGAAGCAHAPPSPASRDLIEGAVRAGHIRWHAQSANYNAAFLGAAAFSAQLREADSLNARFGTRWGSALYKSTDVPGLPRSVVPLLAAAGRTALHTGGNGKCQLARVPQAFTWAHPESGTSVLALASNDYGGTLVVPPHALIIIYQGDNAGPPTAAGVASSYTAAAAAFPGAAVKLSSFEQFVDAALSSTPGAAALPVISSEMGDSWAYGGGADPLKLATFRETRRTIADALAGVLPGQIAPLTSDDPNLRAFERRILVGGPEHNGGCSIGAYLPSSRGLNGEWDNARFHSNLATRADYAFVQSSYDEKLNFTSQPLPPVAPVAPAWNDFLAARATRVAALTPVAPDVSTGWMRVADPAARRVCGRLSVVINASDGSVASLVDVATGHEWAPPSYFMGFTYRTYAEADFDMFNSEYTPTCGVPCPNFAKVGMDSAAPVSIEWRPTLRAAFARTAPAPAACSLALELALPPETVTKYGGAAAVWVMLNVDAAPGGDAPVVALQVSLLNKTATRLAEAGWVTFNPRTELAPATVSLRAGGGNLRATTASPAAWWLNVLGEPVDPLDVVPMGTRHLHAVDSFGFGQGAPRGGPASAFSRSPLTATAPPTVREFSVQTLDAALIAPGDRDHLLHYDGNTLPDMSGGVHVNVFNNLWGTTMAQWWGGSVLYRFNVRLLV